MFEPAQGKEDKQDGPERRRGDGYQAVHRDLTLRYQVVPALEEQPRKRRRQPGRVVGDHEPRDHEPEDAPGQRPTTLEDRAEQQRQRKVEEQPKSEYREAPEKEQRRGGRRGDGRYAGAGQDPRKKE